MRQARAAIIALAFLLTGCSVNAGNGGDGSPGKFQMTSVGNSVFLLNTTTGQMWTPGADGWVETGPMKPATRP